MQLDEWLKWYDKLRVKFGYSIVEDQNSARLLSELLKDKGLDLNILKDLIFSKDVSVIGAGPSLDDDVDKIKSLKSFTIIAADGVCQALIKNKIKPDIVVTDLDGSQEHLLQADKMGSIMVVHAHGDNVNLLRNLVPKMKNCIGTTQVKPLHNVYNFGGFTDGDRAVFLASEFGAENILLIGMDFGKKIGRYSKTMVKDEKLKIAKMEVGKELLEWLASKGSSKLFNASQGSIRGFKKISLDEINSF
ncbi:MAG: 6-hydroxymethylpterin diphosphokinase MptE-like protein [Nitrososphaerales archaeon]